MCGNSHIVVVDDACLVLYMVCIVFSHVIPGLFKGPDMTLPHCCKSHYPHLRQCSTDTIRFSFCLSNLLNIEASGDQGTSEQDGRLTVLRHMNPKVYLEMWFKLTPE